jgi:RTX calcium-binding nonapeptide repeat (4 copies)
MTTIAEFDLAVNQEQAKMKQYVDFLIENFETYTLIAGSDSLSFEELQEVSGAIGILSRTYRAQSIIAAELEIGDPSTAGFALTKFAISELVSEIGAEKIKKLFDKSIIDQLASDGVPINSSLLIRIQTVTTVVAGLAVGDLVELSGTLSKNLLAAIQQAVQNAPPLTQSAFKALIPFDTRASEYTAALKDSGNPNGYDPDSEFSKNVLESAVFAVFGFAGEILKENSDSFILSNPLFAGLTRNEIRGGFTLKPDFLIVNLDKIRAKAGPENSFSGSTFEQLTDAIAEQFRAFVNFALQKEPNYFFVNTTMELTEFFQNIAANLVIINPSLTGIEVRGTGPETIAFLGSNDTAVGSSGDDFFVGGIDLTGGAGKDVLVLDPVRGGVARGGAGDDILLGGFAESGDRLIGGAGNDTLRGHAGDDLLIGGRGNDSIDGGSGFDTVSYRRTDSPDTPASAAIRLIGFLSLITNPASPEGVDVEWSFSGIGGDADGDTLKNIEEIIGSGAADSFEIVTSIAPELPTQNVFTFDFSGEGGNDALTVAAGQASIQISYKGGEGNDVVTINRNDAASKSVFVEFVGGPGADTVSLNSPVDSGFEQIISLDFFDAESDDRGFINDTEVAINFDALDAAENGNNYFIEPDGSFFASVNGFNYFFSPEGGTLTISAVGLSTSIFVSNFDQGDLGIFLPTDAPEQRQLRDKIVWTQFELLGEVESEELDSMSPFDAVDAPGQREQWRQDWLGNADFAQYNHLHLA